MKKGKLSGIGSGLILSACFAFLTCFYAPLELYLTNISEFWIKVTEFIPACLIMFAGIFAVCVIGFVIAKLINEKLFDVCLLAGSSVLLGMYIQGNFLIKNLPDMEGITVDWNAYPAERIKSIIVFAVPFIVFTVLLIKLKSKTFRKVVMAESGIFLALFSVTLVSLFITTDTTSIESVIPTTRSEFELSEDENFIVLLLDAADAQDFKAMLEKRPEAAEELDGFTYYNDAMSTYPATSRSIPMIFSGEWFENTEPFVKYKNDSMENSPFLNNLSAKGYNIGIYEEGYELEKSRFDNKFINYSSSKIVYNSDILKAVLRMGGVKFFPWDLKRFTWKVHRAFILGKVPETEYENFTWDNRAFYNRIKSDSPFEKTDAKCARYIHLSGAHTPFQYDKELNVIKNGTYFQNVDACVSIVEQYIKALKENGLYDNSAIVILADHGYNQDDIKDETKRMNPLLMIKGKNEKHALKFTDAPVSYTDLADGLTKLSDGEKGDSIFDVKDGETRTRRALLFRFNDENHMREIITDGKASDFSAMVVTGKEYNFR